MDKINLTDHEEAITAYMLARKVNHLCSSSAVVRTNSAHHIFEAYAYYNGDETYAVGVIDAKVGESQASSPGIASWQMRMTPFDAVLLLAACEKEIGALAVSDIRDVQVMYGPQDPDHFSLMLAALGLIRLEDHDGDNSLARAVLAQVAVPDGIRESLQGKYSALSGWRGAAAQASVSFTAGFDFAMQPTPRLSWLPEKWRETRFGRWLRRAGLT